MAAGFDGCPHCQNKMGFAFGTCIECGFNYITKQFNKIEVWVEDLPPNIRDYLINWHADRTRRPR